MVQCSIADREQFVVHTGNLAQHTELMMKRHPNSASELTASFKRLAQDEKSKVDLCSNSISLGKCDLGEINKDDVKTTLKVFLSDFSPAQTQSAVEACLSQLGVGQISQLILQFPAQGEDMDDDVWMKEVQRVWNPLEKMLESGKIHALGTADTDMERLKLMCETVNEPPKIDHYSIDGCCTVPQELVEYAKAHDIQLLTHNDTRVFALEDDFQEQSQKIFGPQIDQFSVSWAARYTIWLRSRSVMAAKGYFVEFVKNSELKL